MRDKITLHMRAKTWAKAILFLIWLIACGNLAQAQTKKRVHHYKKTDSVLLDMNSRLSDSILQEAEIKDTAIPNMVNKVESYSFRLNRAESFLNNKLDTGGILKALSRLERTLNYFHNRLERNDNPLNLRNLNTTSVLLDESQEKLTDWQALLDGLSDQMEKNHTHIRQIKHDSTLLNTSLDSTLHGGMKAVHDRSLSLDSLQHTATIKINSLRNRISVNNLLMRDLKTEIQYRLTQQRNGMWNPEEPALPIARATDYDVSLSSVVTDALSRSLRVVKVFMATTWDTRSINIGIFLVLLVWFLINLHQIKKTKDNVLILKNVKFLTRSAFPAALLLLFTYGSFLYASAPAVYLHCNELCRLLVLSFLLIPYLGRTGKGIWLCLSLIWISFAIDDLLLDSAYGERWWLMIAGIALILLCLLMLRKKTVLFKDLEDSPARNTVLILTLFQAVISVTCNFSGMVTLSKLFAISSIDSLVLAVTLKVCSTILVDAVYIQSEAYLNNRFSAFLNFVDLKNKLRRILWVITILAWSFSILRNLTFYDPVYHFLDFFFNRRRAIGSITYSYSSVVLFLLIIWISSVLSQFVSFFFDQNRHAGIQKKSKLGSVTLIVRITIWTAGFLIAIAAAGIPIDKLSILLGALGVGIGFGLQNLVNNLVSGIIIAFERPMQIGDTIEISGKTGTVQEIGVRSSKINNGEGASIIIPNGDLLSQQLTNWTLNDRSRSVKISVAVPYTSDFRKARDLIEEEVRKNDKILKSPAATTTVNSFADNAVNFEISFWVSDLSEISSLRNELMLCIFESFAKNGIIMG
jgi:small-conductance mechanosensitive channel